MGLNSDSSSLFLVPMKSEVISGANIDNWKEKGALNNGNVTAMDFRYTEKIHTQMPILHAALFWWSPRELGIY